MDLTDFHISLLLSGLILLMELILAYGLLKTYRLPVLSAFFYYLFFINVFSFNGLWNEHLFTLLSGHSLSGVPASVLLVFKYVAVPFFILGNYYFIKFFRLLSGTPLSLRFIVLFFCFQVLIAVGTGVTIVFMNDFAISAHNLQIHLERLFTLNEGVCILIALLQPFIIASPHPDQQKRARAMALYYLILTPVYLLLLNLDDIPVMNLANMVSFPVFDLVPLVWLAIILRQHGSEVFSPVPASRFEAWVRQFRITPREQQIVQLICDGKSNKEISALLHISLQTVKDHNHNIFNKTGVKSRSQLIFLVNSSENV